MPAAFLGLGRVALAQGQPAIAIQHFGDGLAVEPDSVALLMARGDAQLQLDDATDERVSTFVRKYARGEQTLEPGAPCTGGTGTPE